MKMPGLRISTNRDEILKVLNEKFQKHISFTMWQKNPETGERNFVIVADLMALDLVDGNFSVKVKPEDLSKFNSNLTTYFLIDGQAFAFKSKQSLYQSNISNVISFLAPKEVRLLELRSNERKYFKLSEEITVNVKFNTLNNDKSEDLKAICRVFNVSNGGICIIITKETLSNVDLKKKLIIEGLNFFKYDLNIKEAIVRNARVYSKKSIKSDELFAIGLEFQS